MSARPRTSLTTAALLLTAGTLVTACSAASQGAAPTATANPIPPTSVASPAAATAAASTTTSTTTAPATAPAATSAPGAPGAPSRSTPVTAAARPFVADPWNRDYEFGFVWGARRSGDKVTLTFDPAGMLLGRQAKAYHDAHQDEERFDVKILNDKSFTQTLRVPAGATLYGNQVLGPRNGSRNERVDLGRLLARASGDDQDRLAVWVKRTGNGPVAYLAEQYLP